MKEARLRRETLPHLGENQSVVVPQYGPVTVYNTFYKIFFKMAASMMQCLLVFVVCSVLMCRFAYSVISNLLNCFTAP